MTAPSWLLIDAPSSEKSFVQISSGRRVMVVPESKMAGSAKLEAVRTSVPEELVAERDVHATVNEVTRRERPVE
jgi:hypothetical protein